MPNSCAVIGCTSRGNVSGRKLYRFPMLNTTSSKTLSITQARQQAWVIALNRGNFFAHEYSNARICDLHFISGQAASYTDVNNVDWVPSKQMGYQKPTEVNLIDVEQSNLKSTESNRIDAEHFNLESTEANQTELLNVEHRTYESHVSIGTQTAEVSQVSTGMQTDESPNVSIGTQTDGTITCMSNEIILSYKEQIQLLEEMLSAHNVALENFRGQDSKTNFFTGISHFATLEALFELFEPDIPDSRKLTKFQIMFIVLTRLRLNLTFKYMSYQFNVSIPIISKYFYSCLSIMHLKLRHFVYWPDRESLKKTMPLMFQNNFGNSIVVVIDCFEVFIERPSNILAAAQCWSHYKHATTIKYLIGITPQGFISFISKGYGGRSSDKFITESGELFKKLETGDVVMADRGFLIEESLKHRGVELNIPAFTKGKTQLHPIEIESTRNIANVRIHVERIIGQLRLKFTILHQLKFPISLIKKNTPSSTNVIDQIVGVCCALSNLCNPIVCAVSDDTL